MLILIFCLSRIVRFAHSLPWSIRPVPLVWIRIWHGGVIAENIIFELWNIDKEEWSVSEKLQAEVLSLNVHYQVLIVGKKFFVRALWREGRKVSPWYAI